MPAGGEAAAAWYYQAGLSCLCSRNEEGVLWCAGEIRDLTAVAGLTVPNSSLAGLLESAVTSSYDHWATEE